MPLRPFFVRQVMSNHWFYPPPKVERGPSEQYFQQPTHQTVLLWLQLPRITKREGAGGNCSHRLLMCVVKFYTIFFNGSHKLWTSNVVTVGSPPGQKGQVCSIL
jgi:uncharacterized membrane protein